MLIGFIVRYIKTRSFFFQSGFTCETYGFLVPKAHYVVT